jgi:uncharacterized protein (TIGR03435 family)
MTFSVTNVSLRGLVDIAYHVEDTQVQGLPHWAGSTRYDIAAKPEGDKPLSDGELQTALQNLLSQRLGLTAHRETKTVPGFRLVVANGGPKLKQTTSERETRGLSFNQWSEGSEL